MVQKEVQDYFKKHELSQSLTETLPQSGLTIHPQIINAIVQKVKSQLLSQQPQPLSQQDHQPIDT